MITTVYLNRDKHIETLDITNMHVLGKNKQEEKSKIPICSQQQQLSNVLFSTQCDSFLFSSFQGFCYRSSSTLVFLIIKVILFFIALCVLLFMSLFYFYFFSPFFILFYFLDCSAQLFHFWGSILCSTLQGSFHLRCFTFFLSSVSFWSFYKYFLLPTS